MAGAKGPVAIITGVILVGAIPGISKAAENILEEHPETTHALEHYFAGLSFGEQMAWAVGIWLVLYFLIFRRFK